MIMMQVQLNLLLYMYLFRRVLFSLSYVLVLLYDIIAVMQIRKGFVPRYIEEINVLEQSFLLFQR